MVYFFAVDGEIAFFFEDLDVDVLMRGWDEFDFGDRQPAIHRHLAHFFFKILAHIGFHAVFKALPRLSNGLEGQYVAFAGDDGGFQRSRLCMDGDRREKYPSQTNCASRNQLLHTIMICADVRVCRRSGWKNAGMVIFGGMECIAFTEAYTRTAENAGAQALVRATEAAAMQGWRIVAIPAEWEPGDAPDLLAHLPDDQSPQPAVWIGFIPSPEIYAALHGAAAAKNIHLLNDLPGHLLAQEFDRYYPYLKGLTPESAVLDAVDQVPAVAAQLGFPIFVRGTLQSRKFKGLAACLAHDAAELATLVTELLPNARSRGRVIARKYVPLRHVQSYQGFPQGREYRVFLLDGEVVALGYYWDQVDALAKLSAIEEIEVRALATKAAQRLSARWVAIDIGQAATGEWWVIESGDAQFPGLVQISALTLFGELGARLKAKNQGI